jgi:Fe-Mn family superoxide dismutase
MSAETFDYHHGKPHKAYVDKANKMTEGTDIQDMDLASAVVAAKDAWFSSLNRSVRKKGRKKES